MTHCSCHVSVSFWRCINTTLPLQVSQLLSEDGHFFLVTVSENDPMGKFQICAVCSVVQTCVYSDMTIFRLTFHACESELCERMLNAHLLSRSVLRDGCQRLVRYHGLRLNFIPPWKDLKTYEWTSNLESQTPFL